MTDVAFAPTWQRTPQRRWVVLAVLLALMIVGYASAPRLTVDWRDGTCGPGTTPRWVSIVDYAVICVPDPTSTTTSTWRVRRYVGLFLENVDVRIFASDFLAGVYEGPALLK